MDNINYNGFVAVKIFDESDNLVRLYSGYNSNTLRFQSLIAQGLSGGSNLVIKPQNIAFFSNPAYANTLTGGQNLNGTTASLSGYPSLSASLYDPYGVKFTFSHKNPASGSTQRIFSISMGRDWNSTYNQWNNNFAHISVDKLNLNFSLESDGSMLVYPKERMSIDWIISPK